MKRKTARTRFEITFLDTGKTVVWTEAKAQEVFGKSEWVEYCGNFLPHVFVAEVEEVTPDGQ
tara:strand:- start:686 stop:871 length:186 start_codon:yes stop_codon:yes gene_type:complete